MSSVASPSGISALAPSAAEATSLADLTGLADASAIAAVDDICGSPTLGQAACMAQLLVNRSTGEALPARVRIDDASSCNGIDSEPAVLGTPQYFQQAYDLGSLASSYGASSTVAIVDAFGYADAAADLATYRNCFGLPAANLDVVNQDGSSDDLPADPTGDETGWELEQALDLDAVSSVCPLCHIILVQATSNDDGDLLAAEHTAASLGATVISNSWSGGGPIGSDSDFVYPGVATTAAAGDFGYLPNPPYVDYPAAYPDVTAVGGTTCSRRPPRIREGSTRWWRLRTRAAARRSPSRRGRRIPAAPAGSTTTSRPMARRQPESSSTTRAYTAPSAPTTPVAAAFPEAPRVIVGESGALVGSGFGV